MTVELRTPDQIAKMRVAGRLAAEVLELIGEYVVPGVTTEELDRICHEHIVNVQKSIPACLGYHGFPKSVCTSVNQVVCHGIPADKKILKNGYFDQNDKGSQHPLNQAIHHDCLKSIAYLTDHDMDKDVESNFLPLKFKTKSEGKAQSFFGTLINKITFIG